MTKMRWLLCLVLWVLPAFANAQQCADGLDNNSNGLFDLHDWYCKSPADNDESSFASGVPGDDQNTPAALDCWFDTNSGSGDDGCSIHACCEIAGPCPENLNPAQFDPEQCSVGAGCASNCVPQTKPGCDCFGCCELCTPGTGCIDVMINPVVSPSCTMGVLGDETLCPRCNQNADCRVLPKIFANGFEAVFPAVISLRQALESAVR